MIRDLVACLLCVAAAWAHNVSDEQGLQLCHTVTDCATCLKTKTLEPLPGPCGWCRSSGKCWDAQHLDSMCTLNCVGSLLWYPNCLHHSCPAPGPSPPPPGPAPPGGPKVGQVFCGSVGGSWDLKANITILADGKSMSYMWQSAQAPHTASCPHEPYYWTPGLGCDAKTNPGCGTMDISSTLKQQSDCLAKFVKSEGGSKKKFIYNGDGAQSIDDQDSIIGTVTMSLAKGSSCDAPPGPGPAPAPPPGPAPPPSPPPSSGPKAGQLYCGSVGGSWDLHVNITILADGKSMKYQWNAAKKPFVVSCPKEAYTWQPSVGCNPTAAGCGTMDVSAAMADAGDCLAQSAKAEGGAKRSFVYNGDEAKTITSQDSLYGNINLALATGKTCGTELAFV